MSIPKVAILLKDPVFNDHRVVKMIQTISKRATVHLFYMDGDPMVDQLLFGQSVSLFCFSSKNAFKQRFLRHSFFCFEFNCFIKQVLSKDISYDYIWANDLPTLYPAFKLSKKIKAKLIYDSHEIYTETINQFFPRNATGGKKLIFSFLIKLMRSHGKRVENSIMPSAHTFVTVNHSLLNYFKEHTRVSNGIVIMNLPMLQENDINRVDYRSIYKWKTSDTILVYQGILNEGRGLTNLLKAYTRIDDSIKLIILGNGPLKDSLKDFVEKCALQDRVKFIDAVSLAELPAYTKGADIGLNLLEAYNLSKKLASPNKLFEYIHASIPVIASYSVENEAVFNKYKIGLLTDNNPDNIALTVKKMISSDLSEYIKNCNKAKLEYNWQHQIESINSIFE